MAQSDVKTRKGNSKSKATGVNGKDIVQQWLYKLKVPVPVKKQAFSDAMFFLSTKGITDLDNLTKEQVDILNNVLGNYGVRAIEWRKYYPQTAVKSATAQPTAVKSATAQPTMTKSATTWRQNLTFNDLLSDLGLTGKESANPEALKKVQDWLAARPGYKPGAKTNAYLKQLRSMPAEKKKSIVTAKMQQPKKNQAPRPSATGKGYTFKNRGLYRDAMRAYNAGGTTFVGNDGNAEFFNKYDISKFTISDVNQKVVLNPNIISAIKQRF